MNGPSEQFWDWIEEIIKAFVAEYPSQWYLFYRDLKARNSEYGLALEGDLKKADWRNTLSFPVIRNPEDGEEDCLLPVLEREFKRIGYRFPKDKTVYREFCKRFGGYFMVPDKL